MTPNEQFLANPLQFMRLFAVSPPDGTPMGAVIKTWTVGKSCYKSGVTLDDNLKVPLQCMDGGPRVQFMTIAAHSTFPEALTLELRASRTKSDQIPIHWLPWRTETVVTTSIPEVPRNLVDPDDDVHPRFFFTAGISGCSVFIKGPATRPTLFRSGTTHKLDVDAKEFWRTQIDIATDGKVYDYGIFSDVDKSQYMNGKSPAIASFLKWANEVESGKKEFEVELVSNFGCVFGIRFGHHWSFYLQESGVVTIARFVKRGDLSVTKLGGSKTYTQTSTGVTVEKKTLLHGRKLGILPLPAKKERIYKSVKQRCAPFQVSEVFPNRHWSGRIKDVVVRQTR